MNAVPGVEVGHCILQNTLWPAVKTVLNKSSGFSVLFFPGFYSSCWWKRESVGEKEVSGEVSSIIVIDIIYHKGLIEFIILKGVGVGKFENIFLKELGPQLAEFSVFTSAFRYSNS